MPTLTVTGPDLATVIDFTADPPGTGTPFGPVVRCFGCGRPGVALATTDGTPAAAPTVVGHVLPVAVEGDGGVPHRPAAVRPADGHLPPAGGGVRERRPGVPVTRGRPLTAREDRFVREYLAEPIGTRAYLRAFATRQKRPTYATARSEAARLLANPSIRAAVAAGRKDLRRRLRVSALRVLRELAAVAFADPIDAWEFDEATGQEWARPLREVPADFRRAIASRKVTRRRTTRSDGGETVTVESVEFRQADKLAALDKLGKHLGLFADGAALDELLALLRQQAWPSGPPIPTTAPAAGEADADDTGP